MKPYDRYTFGEAWPAYRPGRWLSKARKAANVMVALAWAKSRRPSFPGTLIDVGARWGPSGPWVAAHKMHLVDLVLVEPDPVEARQLAHRWPRAQIVDVALGTGQGHVDLHITREPGRSSLLLPDQERIRDLDGGDAYDVERTVRIPIDRLDAVLAKGTPIHFVKIDVQGSELDVLAGFGALLGSVVGVELEVALQKTYQGQASLGEVNEYFLHNGFVPVDVRPLGLGQHGIVEANWFYCRRDVDGRALELQRFWRLLNGLPTNAALQHRM